MHRWRWGFIALVLAAAPASGQTRLAWKWREQDKVYVQTETRVRQTMVLADPRAPASKPGANPANDREVRQEFKHGTLLSYAVHKRNEDGSAEIVQTVEDVVVRGDADKRDVLLAPTTPREQGGAALTLHVSPRGEVSKVEGHAKLLDRLAGTDPGRRQALAEALSEDTLKQSAAAALGFLPADAVKPGDKWDRKTSLGLGALGRLRVEHAYVYAGKDVEAKTLDSIGCKSTVVGFEPSKVRSQSFQVTDGTLGGEGTGTLLFDAEAGRLVRATTTLNLQGTLTFKNSDTTYRAKLLQEHTVQTTVMDKPPPR